MLTRRIKIGGSDSKIKLTRRKTTVEPKKHIIKRRKSSDTDNKKRRIVVGRKFKSDEKVDRKVDFEEGFYPDIEDSHFEQKLYNKREFRELTLQPDYLNKITIEDTCSTTDKPFILSNVQRFVSRFLSPATPYNSALLYHGVGVGKTCSAVSISETFLAEGGGAKRVHMIVPKHIEDNFRRTIFNSMWLMQPDATLDTVSKRQCTGDTYLTMATMSEPDLPPEKLMHLIDKLIKRRYIFYSYQKFSNVIRNWQREISTKLKYAELDPLNPSIALTEERRKELMDEEIRRQIDSVFSGSVIIVDEAHNLRVSVDASTSSESTDEIQEEEKENNADEISIEEPVEEIKQNTEVPGIVKQLTAAERKRITEALRLVLVNSSGAKLVLLSATPMFNESREIITLLNLLRLNDKRSTISDEGIFDDTGNITNIGKDIISRASKGYISYMRGENPVTFPIRLYPKNVSKLEDMPTHDALGKVLHLNSSQIIPSYTSEVAGDQLDVMTEMQQLLLANRKEGGIPFTVADMAVQCSSIIYPIFDDELVENEDINVDEQVENKDGNVDIKTVENIDENVVEIAENEDTHVRSTSAVPTYLRTRFGLTGFKRYFKEIRDSSKGKGQDAARAIGITQTSPIQYRFKREKLDTVQKLLLPIYGGELTNYSGKMATILENINAGEGISLVASRWLPIGALSMALLLELHGYDRFVPNAQGVMDAGSNHNLLTITPEIKEFLFASGIKRKCALCNAPPVEHGEDGTADHEFKQARYILLSGNKEISPAFNECVRIARSDDNKNGELIKVILGVRVIEEGLDLRFVRQVHIMEPWFHLNRAEQIIGRGVRQCSHAGLDANKRNTLIYLHSTAYPATDEKDWGWRETIDMYIYRLALVKAQRIGEVSRILKENAIDCEINYSGNHFLEREHVVMIDSIGNKHDITFADKPGSSVCDYLADCNYKCIPHIDKSEPEDISTYSILVAREVVREVQSIIKTLFITNEIISAIELYRILVENYNIPVHIFYEALYEMANNSRMRIIHGTDKQITGYIVRRGIYYAFQPIDITDVRIPLIQRTYAPEKHAETYMLERVSLDAENEAINENDGIKYIGFVNFKYSASIRLAAFWDMLNDAMQNYEAYKDSIMFNQRSKGPQPDKTPAHANWIEKVLTFTTDYGEEQVGDLQNQFMTELACFPELAYFFRTLMDDKTLPINELIDSIMECAFDYNFTWREKRQLYLEYKNGKLNGDVGYNKILKRIFRDVELKIGQSDGKQNVFFMVPTYAIPVELETKAKSKKVIKHQRGKERPPHEYEINEFNEDLAIQGMESFVIDKVVDTKIEESNLTSLRLYFKIQDWISERLLLLPESGNDVFGGNYVSREDGQLAFVRCHQYHMREPDKTTNISEQLGFIMVFLNSVQGLNIDSDCDGVTGVWKNILQMFSKRIEEFMDDTPVDLGIKKNKKGLEVEKKTTVGELNRKEMNISKWTYCRFLDVLLRVANENEFCDRRWFFRPTEFHILYGPVTLWRALHL